MTNAEKLTLAKHACHIRMGVIEGTHSAKCGHPGGSLDLSLIHIFVSPFIIFLYLRCNPYPLVFRCLKESGLTAFFTRSSAANIPVNMALCEKLGLSLIHILMNTNSTRAMLNSACRCRPPA